MNLCYNNKSLQNDADENFTEHTGSKDHEIHSMHHCTCEPVFKEPCKPI